MSAGLLETDSMRDLLTTPAYYSIRGGIHTVWVVMGLGSSSYGNLTIVFSGLYFSQE